MRISSLKTPEISSRSTYHILRARCYFSWYTLRDDITLAKTPRNETPASVAQEIDDLKAQHRVIIDKLLDLHGAEYDQEIDDLYLEIAESFATDQDYLNETEVGV